MINSAQFIRASSNKSFITNAIAFLLIGLSYCFINTPYERVLSNIGYFALSCALTNWIAIVMLFEKVPFLYGSGIIPARFEEFKTGIKNLVMQEFFTQDNIEKVTSAHFDKEKWQEIAGIVDYDKIYDALVDGILESKIGKLITMMGGQNAIEPLREPVQKKLAQAFEEILADENLQVKLKQKLGFSEGNDFLIKIERIVDNRLEKLTPNKVKEIIQKMIREHLGWLVVWGGVFGGLIGLATSFV